MNEEVESEEAVTLREAIGKAVVGHAVARRRIQHAGSTA